MKWTPRFRSVRHRLLAAVLLTSLAALLVSGGALLVYDLRSYRAAGESDLTTQAELIGRATAAALQFDDPKFAADNLALLRVRQTIRGAAIYNSRGAVFARYLRPDAAEGLPRLPGADGVQVDGHRMTVFRRVVENGEILGTVYLAADYEVARRLTSFALSAGGVMLVALLISLLLSTRLQTAVSGPIIRIAHLAREVVEHRDYSVRAAITSDDEIGMLATAFNDMLSEIERRTSALEHSNKELERAQHELQDLTAELEQRVRQRTAQLEDMNRELEAFSYSVSHDLRAPLRAIDGFSLALVEDFGDQADGEIKRYLSRIRAATQRMGQLIEDLLTLSRISRVELSWSTVDLSAMARQVADELKQRDAERSVEVSIWEGVTVQGDPRLLRIALENLLGNAWKFTAKKNQARVEFGALEEPGRSTFFVRDNGAGFDMAHAENLFGAFQRLHAVSDYPGTGIGLATVQRIVHRHGGRIWAHAQPNRGATFFFTLGEADDMPQAADDAGRDASAAP